jgi:hypothetical protein
MAWAETMLPEEIVKGCIEALKCDQHVEIEIIGIQRKYRSVSKVWFTIPQE